MADDPDFDDPRDLSTGEFLALVAMLGLVAFALTLLGLHTLA